MWAEHVVLHYHIEVNVLKKMATQNRCAKNPAEVKNKTFDQSIWLTLHFHIKKVSTSLNEWDGFSLPPKRQHCYLLFSFFRFLFCLRL